MCLHRNVVWPLRRGYVLLSASLPEGSHGALNLLNWMTGQNHTSTRNPHHLPENKGVWRELMLKNDDYSFSQEQVTLFNSCWKWTLWHRLLLSPRVLITVVPQHWRHTGLLRSASCSGWTVKHGPFYYVWTLFCFIWTLASCLPPQYLHI